MFSESGGTQQRELGGAADPLDGWTHGGQQRTEEVCCLSVSGHVTEAEIRTRPSANHQLTLAGEGGGFGETHKLLKGLHAQLWIRASFFNNVVKHARQVFDSWDGASLARDGEHGHRLSLSWWSCS